MGDDHPESPVIEESQIFSLHHEILSPQNQFFTIRSKGISSTDFEGEVKVFQFIAEIGSSLVGVLLQEVFSGNRQERNDIGLLRIQLFEGKLRLLQTRSHNPLEIGKGKSEGLSQSKFLHLSRINQDLRFRNFLQPSVGGQMDNQLVIHSCDYGNVDITEDTCLGIHFLASQRRVASRGR